MVSIPRLEDKWELIAQQLKDEGCTEDYLILLKYAFYRGIRTYIKMQKELRMELTSFQMDQVLHAWELEVYKHDYF